MSGSGWDYVTPYEGSAEQSLRALHQKVFDEEFAHGRNPELFGHSMPTYGSLEELWADRQFMDEVGTHTVIDVYRHIPADGQLGPYEHYNTIRPLSDECLEHYFGTSRPTVQQFREAIDHADQVIRIPPPRSERVLLDEADARWTARYVVLYTDGQPTHMGVFGSSGD